MDAQVFCFRTGDSDGSNAGGSGRGGISSGSTLIMPGASGLSIGTYADLEKMLQLPTHGGGGGVNGGNGNGRRGTI